MAVPPKTAFHRCWNSPPADAFIRRVHQALGYRTNMPVWLAGTASAKAADMMANAARLTPSLRRPFPQASLDGTFDQLRPPQPRKTNPWRHDRRKTGAAGFAPQKPVQAVPPRGSISPDRNSTVVFLICTRARNLNPHRPNDPKPTFKVTRFPERAEQTGRSWGLTIALAPRGLARHGCRVATLGALGALRTKLSMRSRSRLKLASMWPSNSRVRASLTRIGSTKWPFTTIS